MKIIVRDSLLDRVFGSVGTSMFRHLYVRDGKGKKRDILEDGDKSCALFSTTVLIGFGLVNAVHATVGGTIKDMEASGWVRIKKPRAGCVVVWDVNDGREQHQHIGFYVGGGMAISNSSERRSPHNHTYHKHKVVALYWHPRLD